MEGWADGIKASNEERHPRGMIKTLKERGLIDDQFLMIRNWVVSSRKRCMTKWVNS